MTPDPPTESRSRRWLFIAILACMPVLAIALAEGVASLIVFARDMAAPVQERRPHTIYDSLLGWASRPNLSLPNFYGPDRHLHTDSAGLRITGSDAVEGGRRIVCVGDSFTFGLGVSDEQTWCARIGAASAATRSINMGQTGFGIDQAFLWYARDGRALAPDLVLLGFVWADFDRMRLQQFINYPKPTLVVAGDSLAPAGVPVPRMGGLRRSLLRNLPTFATLRSWQLVARLGQGPEPPADARVSDDAVWLLAQRVFTTLSAWQQARGREFVAVLLPVEIDYTHDYIRPWHDRLKADAERGAYRVIDLWEDFERLPPDSVTMMFIQPSDRVGHHAEGHYSAAGNAWVARRLLAHLASDAAPSRARPR